MQKSRKNLTYPLFKLPFDQKCYYIWGGQFLVQNERTTQSAPKWSRSKTSVLAVARPFVAKYYVRVLEVVFLTFNLISPNFSFLDYLHSGAPKFCLYLIHWICFFVNNTRWCWSHGQYNSWFVYFSSSYVGIISVKMVSSVSKLVKSPVR